MGTIASTAIGNANKKSVSPSLTETETMSKYLEISYRQKILIILVK